jgi:hypothetical protein
VFFYSFDGLFELMDFEEGWTVSGGGGGRNSWRGEMEVGEWENVVGVHEGDVCGRVECEYNVGECEYMCEC